ncbi:LOW QUALITY PROTEIN: uncharacterized protein ACR2FA_012601 [Aphomia sociella]
MAPAADVDAIALIGLLLVILKKDKRRSRTEWCKKWLQKRRKYSHVNLLKELKFYPKSYRNYLRMDEKTYITLLSKVTPLIKKQDTIMRTAISPHERLTVTLKFHATGRPYECLKYSALISPQALNKIIPETCAAIYKVLQKDYLKFPNSSENYRNIAQQIEDRWNFPHCLGAIDGKHIDIIPPVDSGSYYYNYKKRHSMVLMVIVDANYEFLLIYFGTNGRFSDGGILQKNTKFFEMLQDNKIELPNNEVVRNSSTSLPYVFVANDAFPLRTDMLKPFRQADLHSRKRKIFNYRLSRARHIVVNTFGILASWFRIYHTEINLEPKNVEKIVMATCVLHNFLMKHVGSSYAPRECFYEENTANGTIITEGYNTTHSTMLNLQRSQGNILNHAKQVRAKFTNYFVNEGRVSWQDNFVRRIGGKPDRYINPYNYDVGDISHVDYNPEKLKPTSGIANQSVGQDLVAHATTSSSSPDESTSVTTCFSTNNCQVLLATALVKAQSKTGNGITIRCLIDPGSQASFITESAVQLLKLKKISHKSTISGLGGEQGSLLASKYMVNIKLHSLHDPNFTCKVQAFVLDKLTSILPERQLILELRSEFSDINLADPFFYKPNKIDFLLGADVYSLLLDGVIKGPPGVPMAHFTSRRELAASGSKISNDRITTLACANATGSHRLPMLVIGKSKKPRCLKHVNMSAMPIVYTSQKSAWMNSTIFMEWFTKTFILSVKAHQLKNGKREKTLLLLDYAPTHP